MPAERIQKILAQAGLASRRKAEELISQGEVTVNGKIAKLGDKAEMGKDAIKVSGKLLRTTEVPVYIVVNKPKGVLSLLAADPEGRPTLESLLKKIRKRVYPVDKLEFNTEGLLILTNDGNVASKLKQQLEIPQYFEVKVKGHPDPKAIAKLARGGRLSGKLVRPYAVKVAERLANKTKVEFVLQGLQAVDLKTFFEQKGLLFESIVRTQVGQVALKGLKPGEHRILKKSQILAMIEHPELGLRGLESPIVPTA